MYTEFPLNLSESRLSGLLSGDSTPEKISESLGTHFEVAYNKLAHSRKFDKEAVIKNFEILSAKGNNAANLSTTQITRAAKCNPVCMDNVLDEINGLIPPEDYQYDSQEEAEANGQEWPYDDRY